MATITLTTAGGAQDQRIAAAVGHYLQKGGNATMAEVKGVLMADLKALVLREEELMRQEGLAAIVPVDLT